MTEQECISADWRAVGYEQAIQGKDTRQFEHFRKDCAKHTVTANLDEFWQGHLEGLKHYCSFDNGLALGQQGKPYNTTCSSSKYSEFDEGHRAGVYQYCNYNNGYETGKKGQQPDPICPFETFGSYARGFDYGTEKYYLLKKIHRLEDDLDDIEDEMKQVRSEIRRLEPLRDNATTRNERELARASIRTNKRLYRQLDREYHELKDALRHYQQDYDAR